jgi:hypothetical protein
MVTCSVVLVNVGENDDEFGSLQDVLKKMKKQSVAEQYARAKTVC